MCLSIRHVSKLHHAGTESNHGVNGRFVPMCELCGGANSTQKSFRRAAVGCDCPYGIQPPGPLTDRHKNRSSVSSPKAARFRPNGLVGECSQIHAVALSQVPQHVIGPNPIASVRRIRHAVREQQQVWECIDTENLTKVMPRPSGRRHGLRKRRRCFQSENRSAGVQVC